MADPAKRLRFVAFQEGDVWVAQCVEYDLCVQGSDLAQTKRRMHALVCVEAKITADKFGEAFAGIPRAPEMFEAIFENAESELVGDLNMRLAA